LIEMKNLIIVGAGGFGREVFTWAKMHPDCGREWRIAGFLDDNLFALDRFDYPISIIGSIADYRPVEEDVCVCAIGAPLIKQAVCERLLGRSAKFISLVHPSAILGSNVQLGQGVIVCPYAVVTCDVQIGDFVAINCHSTVGHDAKIGHWVTLSGHCDVTGQAELGDRVFLGSGARILPSKKVGSDALIGAGAVVIQGVAAGMKVFGNPARRFDGSD